MSKPKIVAIILAAGSGQRAGFSKPKQLVKLAGRPIIAHTLDRFQKHSAIDEIAIITSATCIDEIEDIVNQSGSNKVRKILLGGASRNESSLAAIRAYEEEATGRKLWLVFHDAVRPLVTDRIISDVLEALGHYAAVDVVIPAIDTIVVADPVTNTISSIPDRQMLRLGQTPQGFHYATLKNAYDRALQDPHFRATDDCGVVVKYVPEEKVYLVEGSTKNMKVTFDDDILIIDKFMQSNAARRIDAISDGMLLSRLHGRVVVIFGGSSGIGMEVARLAEAYGARVFPASRRNGLDISNAEAVQHFVDKIYKQEGRIDAAVNTAGILSRQPLVSMTSSEIQASIGANFHGAVNIAHSIFPYLRESGGHLLFFASSSYTYGRPFYSTYSASKAAVVNLTQALAEEWAQAGVHVNCVNPERTNTPMRTKAFGSEPPETLLDPAEVARKALFILVGHSTGYVYDVAKSWAVEAT